jgi:hypothetical protein
VCRLLIGTLVCTRHSNSARFFRCVGVQRVNTSGVDMGPLLTAMESAQLRLLVLVDRNASGMAQLEWCVDCTSVCVPHVAGCGREAGQRPPTPSHPFPPLPTPSHPYDRILFFCAITTSPPPFVSLQSVYTAHLVALGPMDHPPLCRLVSGPNHLVLDDAVGVLVKAGFHHAVALLYLARGMEREGLAIWRDLGTGLRVEQGRDGVESTKGHLARCCDMVREGPLRVAPVCGTGVGATPR